MGASRTGPFSPVNTLTKSLTSPTLMDTSPYSSAR
jgi:hypothetical protein